MSWFNTVDTVDGVIKSFTDSIAALDTIVDNTEIKAKEIGDEIARLESKNTENNRETSRANQIRSNLQKLIGETS